MESEAFAAWLLAQVDRPDGAGHLARAAVRAGVTAETLAAWLPSAPDVWVHVAKAVYHLDTRKAGRTLDQPEKEGAAGA